MSGTAWTFAVALTLFGAGPPTDHLAEEEKGPKLIVKGKDFFLHTLPPAPVPPSGLRRALGQTTEKDSRSLILLHTSTTTGKMKVLAVGGTKELPLVGQTSSTSSLLWTTRIAGVACDKERLYVLLWKDFTPAKYHLEVFRPADGVLIRSVDLKGDALPKGQPKETSGNGPLRLLPDGVACFGTKFQFKGDQLIKRSSEKKP